MIDKTREIGLAQKELMSAMHSLMSAKMRLEGTKYYKTLDAIYAKLLKLNHDLSRG